MKICYEPKDFSIPHRLIISQANGIIEEWDSAGYTLTLRQLYYQFVAGDLIPNTVQSYKRLGGIVGAARMAGLISWDTIEDRTRSLMAVRSYDNPSAAILEAHQNYALNVWDRQPCYIEVWIEKDALAGVIERPCGRLRVPFIACKGYMSLSEMWAAGERITDKILEGKKVVILHLGDHDPSGIDMTRDIRDRLTLFVSQNLVDRTIDFERLHEDVDFDEGYFGFQVDRIALNMDQVREFNPVPNPTKITDGRARSYLDKYGDKSWELDALRPDFIASEIEDAVRDLLDEGTWKADMATERKQRLELRKIAKSIKEKNWEI